MIEQPDGQCVSAADIASVLMALEGFERERMILRRMAFQIDVMKQKIKWHSVKDDPPPDKTYVLVRYESGHAKVAAYNHFQKAWFTPSGYVMTPHEWMEIPE